MTYSNEDLARIAREHGVKKIAVTGPDIPDETVDITAVRTQLLKQGADYLNQRHHYFKLMNQEAGLAKPGDEKVELAEPGYVAAVMFEATVTAGTFQWTLSTILRLLEQEAPELAQKVAQIADAVLDAGLEAIEDTNDDLPHAYADTPLPAVGARVRVRRPGFPFDGQTGTVAVWHPYGEVGKVGVAIDGRHGVLVFRGDELDVLPAVTA